MKIKVIFKMYCNEAAECDDIEYLNLVKTLVVPGMKTLVLYLLKMEIYIY